MAYSNQLLMVYISIVIQVEEGGFCRLSRAYTNLKRPRKAFTAYIFNNEMVVKRTYILFNLECYRY